MTDEEKEPLSELPLYDAEDPSQRREQIRRHVDLSVTLDSEHNFFAGSATDLSVGGIFIATHILRPIGAKVEFTLHLPGQKRPLKGLGEVRWHRSKGERGGPPAGMGVQFIDLDAEGLDQVEAFLKTREPLAPDKA